MPFSCSHNSNVSPLEIQSWVFSINLPTYLNYLLIQPKGFQCFPSVKRKAYLLGMQTHFLPVATPIPKEMFRRYSIKKVKNNLIHLTTYVSSLLMVKDKI